MTEDRKWDIKEWLPFMAANDPLVYDILKDGGIAYPISARPEEILDEVLHTLIIALYRRYHEFRAGIPQKEDLR